MAFRNDYEAQRARISALERDLERTREELERRDETAAAAETRIQSLERELEAARKKLARMKPESSGQPKALAIGLMALGGVVLAASAGSVLLSERVINSTAPPPPLEGPHASSEPTSDPHPERRPEPTPARPTVGEISVVHQAVVREVQAWPPVQVGDRCRIETTVKPRPDALRIGRIAVRCGATVLYDSAAPNTGFVMSSIAGQAFERRAPGGGERYAYTVLYQDLGMRALPQAQFVLNTQKHSGRVFRSPESEGSIALDILEQWSEPREGEPLLEASSAALAFDEELSAELLLRSVEGPAPVQARPRPSCTLRIRPELAEERLNCRVLLRCEGELLYGADTTGFSRCELDDEGRLIRATDPVATTDGDPELHFDREAGTLTLRDEPAAGAWTARFALAQ